MYSRASGQGPGDGKDQATRIWQPALVVLGGDSPKLNPRFEETYRQLLDWLPDAAGVPLPGATYFFQLESADISALLADSLANFFNGIPWRWSDMVRVASAR